MESDRSTALGPPLPLTIVLWACAGALSSYMTLAQVAFTNAVPDGLRGRAIGVASAGLQTAQGLGVLLAGAIAELVPPSASIAVCALLGAGGATVISLTCGLVAPTGTAPAPASTPPGPGRQPRPVQPR